MLFRVDLHDPGDQGGSGQLPPRRRAGWLQARLADDLANVLMNGPDLPGQDAASNAKDGRIANLLIGTHVQLDQASQGLPGPDQDRKQFLAAVAAA
jgi:hypothetical protein